MNNIFDSHCHYCDDKFNEDRDEVLKYLQENGVVAIIHAGAGLDTSRFGVEYSAKYPFMYTSVGVHPEEITDLPADYLQQLEEMAKSPKVIAIGEIGLDYHYEGYNRDMEIKVFEEQLKLAQKLNLPVIIHSRDATEDCMNLLKKYKPRGVMHCFSGSAETAREVQALGMYVSFTGVVTFKNSKKAQEAVLAVANDRLLLETDCPYMAPEPFRGERCDSTMIPYIAEKIGGLKGMTGQEVLNMCTENTCKLFHIEL